MKKLIVILFLLVGLNNTFAQQKFTPQQIEKVDEAILLAGDSDEDMQGLIEYTSTVLNISKQQSKEYIANRFVDIFSSILTAEAKREQLTKQKRAELGTIYSTLIDKLHRGELLTEEEIASFLSGESYGRFWTVAKGQTICLDPPQKPVAENNIMIYGNGDGRSDGNAHFRHYSATIKKVGALETANAFLEMYTCTRHDGIKEAILGITNKNDKENRTHYWLHYAENGIAHCSTFHFGGQSGTFKGFSESEIHKLKEIQSNLHNMLLIGLNEALSRCEYPYFDCYIDLSKESKKKPKTMPENFENGFFFARQYGAYEIWEAFEPEYDYRAPSDLKIESLHTLLHNLQEQYWGNSTFKRYEGSIIQWMLRGLGNYYLNLNQTELAKEIFSILSSNKQFWGNWQLNNLGITFPVILHHTESGNTFLFEGPGGNNKRISLSRPLKK